MGCHLLYEENSIPPPHCSLSQEVDFSDDYRRANPGSLQNISSTQSANQNLFPNLLDQLDLAQGQEIRFRPRPASNIYCLGLEYWQGANDSTFSDALSTIPDREAEIEDGEELSSGNTEVGVFPQARERVPVADGIVPALQELERESASSQERGLNQTFNQDQNISLD